MKMKIVYTLQAQQDLKNIYEYIAYSLLVPDTARNMSRQIMQSVRSLETMPERNPLYKEEPWHSQGVRFIPVKNYLLFYTVNNETHTVSIARILYGGVGINRQLEENIYFLYLSRKGKRRVPSTPFFFFKFVKILLWGTAFLFLALI